MKQTPAHSIVNLDLYNLIPQGIDRLVEVGCMHGQMGQAYLTNNPNSHYTGIDIDPDYAAVAAKSCTKAICADIEQMSASEFDALFPSRCWIFGDCLEHLRDPWKILHKVREKISPDGVLMVCIPNAQHWSIQWRLLSGNFRYEDSGLLDRTHLRWFTRLTLLEMFEQTGWRIDAGVARMLPETLMQNQILEAIGNFAQQCGLDPLQSINDAKVFQYVYRLFVK